VKYRELPLIEGTTEHHAWNFFAEGDELGTLNRIGPRQLVEAASLVQSGKVISLNLPLDQPGPLAEGRSGYEHHVEVERFGRDDKLDNFFLQGSSQWDGLRHVRYRQHGYFGGRQEDDLDTSGVLGVDRIAERGVFGRGVLLDVAGFYTARGEALPVGERTEITVDMLDRVADAQGVELQPGDVVLVRSGWLGWYQSLTAEQRAEVGTSQTMSCIGLEARPEMAEWLWDNGVAAIACDNPALEALPIRPENGFLHHRILPLLGFLIGELLSLDELADDCRGDGRYIGLMASAPLHLPNGVGSPANAYMIK
jgi:kynurenine formamidase